MNRNLPKRLITSVLLVLFYLNLTHFANAQCPTTAANFSIGCGSSASLIADPAFVSYTPVYTACSATAITGTSVVPLLDNTYNSDDTYTSPINIGFPFSFYGTTYTQAIIQTNGIVGFGAFAYTGFSSFTIPTPTLPNNYIAGFFADIDIRCGGTITYATVGVTPNRKFVASYNNVAPYGGGGGTGGCAGTGTASFQIILNENNTFNVVISQLSANWNATTSGALATSGAENIDGTIAVVVPGRNSTDYPAITPSNQDCYTFTAYLCNFVDWKDGATTISTNPTFAVSPTATKTYTATWQCGPSTCTDPITITVVPPTLVRSTITNSTNCATPNGSIRFTTNFANGTYTLSYDKNGTPTTTSITVAGGAFLLSGLDAGAYTNFSLPISAGCPSILITAIVNITTTPRTMTLSTVTNSTNCATPNGSIRFTTTNVPNGTYTLSYLLNGASASASITITAGVGTVTGLDVGTYTAFSIPTPVGCNPILVAGPATITSPSSPTGTGVSICANAPSVAMTSGLPTPPTIAQGATFNSGTLATTDPTWSRTNFSTCSSTGTGTNVYYDVFTFSVSATGSYTFNMCTPGTNWDGYATIYETNFNPTAICTNYVASDDDGNSGGNCDNDASITATLSTGITYYLVTTSYSNGITGNYDWTYTAQGMPTALTSGSLVSGDPDWTRGTTGTSCNNTAGTTYNYDVFSFTVPTTGSYTLDMCTTGTDWDGFGSLYVNAFNGATPCGTPANFIANDDDGNTATGNCDNDPRITANLTAGLTYYLVTTSFTAGVTGSYGWTITPPAPATIFGGSAVTAQWYTAATGGTPIATTSSFNPVGVAGSGLANTATAGTTTYYLAYSNAPSCRTPITYVISAAPVAPTSITNTGGGFVCNGSSVTLNAVGGSSGGGAGVLTWYSGACGTGTLLGTGASIDVSPIVTTNYFVRYEGSCGSSTCANTSITVNTVATAPTISGVPALNCPNTNLTLTASGGTAGSGSSINWYSAPLGGGTLLGTGATLVVAPMSTTTYYVRRDGGTCGDSPDASVVVTVRNFAYATGSTTVSSNYCMDKDGWQHFFNGSGEIYFSINGNIGATPIATVKVNGSSFQFPNVPTNCPAVNPGEEKFEMARSWNFDLNGTAPTGTYSIRFYYLTAERTAIEAAALAWKNAVANTACVYGYKSPTPNGFYWFKNSTGGAYSAPQYDGLQLNSTDNSVLGINYAEIIGITSFSGGSGAVTLIPLVPLPVSLLSFSGKRTTPNQVKISWETVQEINNAGFEVEMSADARNFDKIAFVKGIGNDKIVGNYEILHNNSVGGYFRLKQIDNNGRYAYSKIIYIEGTSESVIRIYPNPATDNVTIDLGQLKTNESANAIFRSMLGVVVSEKILSQVQTDISVAHLAKGIYTVEIIKNGQKIIQKIALQ